MKKIILTCLLFASIVFTGNAQTKEALLQKIDDSYSWASARMVENYITLNLSDAMWAEILKSPSHGVRVFDMVGRDIAAYSDKFYGSFLGRDCGSTSRNIEGEARTKCEADVKKMSSKFNLTLNTKDLKQTENSHKLTIDCMRYVGEFIDAENGVFEGVKQDWKPKGDKLSIIINPVFKTGMPTVSWSTDGSVATITMPVENETPSWWNELYKGLQKGFVKNK